MNYTQNEKNNIVVDMEPTGHDCFNLGHFLKNLDIRIVLVNPFHVKRSKELDDNSQTKNDHKDRKSIAKLVIEGSVVNTKGISNTRKSFSNRCSANSSNLEKRGQTCHRH